MSKRTQIKILVNERAEIFYDRSVALGTLAAHTFLEEDHPRGHAISAKTLQKHRAQLTGLENLAETTLKVTDVLDYLKKQIARPGPDHKGWREVYQGKRFGESLKQVIEQNLPDDVAYICSKLHIGNETLDDRRDRQYIYLQLVRQLVRQVVVQYEYQVSQKEEELRDAQRARADRNPATQR